MTRNRKRELRAKFYTWAAITLRDADLDVGDLNMYESAYLRDERESIVHRLLHEAIKYDASRLLHESIKYDTIGADDDAI